MEILFTDECMPLIFRYEGPFHLLDWSVVYYHRVNYDSLVNSEFSHLFGMTSPVKNTITQVKFSRISGGTHMQRTHRIFCTYWIQIFDGVTDGQSVGFIQFMLISRLISNPVSGNTVDVINYSSCRTGDWKGFLTCNRQVGNEYVAGFCLINCAEKPNN